MSVPPPAGGHSSPATARNREPILAVLRDVLPTNPRVLEIASGAGEHAVFAAEHLPGATWLPTDQDPQALASIAAWRQAARACPTCWRRSVSTSPPEAGPPAPSTPWSAST